MAIRTDQPATADGSHWWKLRFHFVVASAFPAPDDETVNLVVIRNHQQGAALTAEIMIGVFSHSYRGRGWDDIANSRRRNHSQLERPFLHGDASATLNTNPVNGEELGSLGVRNSGLRSRDHLLVSDCAAPARHPPTGHRPVSLSGFQYIFGCRYAFVRSTSVFVPSRHCTLLRTHKS